MAVSFSPEREVSPFEMRTAEEAARFRIAVREAAAQADRGELLEDDAVREWLERRERS